MSPAPSLSHWQPSNTAHHISICCLSINFLFCRPWTPQIDILLRVPWDFHRIAQREYIFGARCIASLDFPTNFMVALGIPGTLGICGGFPRNTLASWVDPGSYFYTSRDLYFKSNCINWLTSTHISCLFREHVASVYCE